MGRWKEILCVLVIVSSAIYGFFMIFHGNMGRAENLEESEDNVGVNKQCLLTEAGAGM